MLKLPSSQTSTVPAIVAMYAGVHIEGYLGILIGLFIIKSGIEFLLNAISSIVGKRAEREIALGIKQLVNSFPEVIGSYDLILNDYGPNRSIGSIHIEVRDDLTAKEIHPLTRKISLAAYEKFGVILTVGIYATNSSVPEVKAIREDLYRLVKNYPAIKQVHGFYVDVETNVVSFDLIIDYEAPNQEEIKNSLVNDLSELHKDYQFFVVLDYDFAD